jgi:hypothetical protein
MARDLANYAYLLETAKQVLTVLSKDLKQDESVLRSYLGN